MAVSIRIHTSVLVLLVFLTASQMSYSQAKDADTIRVDTQLVLVPISVRDQKGIGISGLSRDRFKILEDGVEQEIIDFETPGAPITVALVIDMSDSARISLAEMRKAASAFIDRLEARDKAMIVAFDKSTHRVIGATGDRETLKLGLAGISTGGGTALYDTVEHVMTKSFDGVSGRKAVAILTDAIDTSSIKTTLERSAELVAGGNIPFFPVQYQPEDTMRKRLSSENSHIGSTIYTTPTGESIMAAHQRGTRYLRLLADSSGGRFQLADSTKNLEAAFAQIAAELRQLYYIGYYSNKEATKAEKRKLTVKVDIPNARVESRDSYIAKP